MRKHLLYAVLTILLACGGDTVMDSISQIEPKGVELLTIDLPAEPGSTFREIKDASIVLADLPIIHVYVESSTAPPGHARPLWALADPSAYVIGEGKIVFMKGNAFKVVIATSIE